jgi:pimeloyl-ACP methyl ester carboxylesterase
VVAGAVLPLVVHPRHPGQRLQNLGPGQDPLALVGVETNPLPLGRAWLYRPGQFDGIAAPALLLTRSESPPALIKSTHQAAAAIPDARIHVLQGHGHLAIRTDPAMVATVIRQFISS